MEYVGKIPFVLLMLVALGELLLHATAKSALLVAYMWGRMGGRRAVKALLRPGPPFGGYLKIGADVLVFVITQALIYGIYRLGQRSEGAWTKTLADVWQQGVWAKIWMSAAVITAVGLISIKLLDLIITVFSLRTYASDADSEAPPVRRRLLFVTGLEFVLWQLIGWLGSVALFLARYILGAGWARWMVKHALGNLSMTPEEFFKRFYEANVSGTKGEKAKCFFNYIIRFAVVRGLAVAFFGLALW